jgi:hypothetical protein
MGIKSFWLSNDIDEEKLKKIARNQNKSISKIVNNLLKEKYDVFKKRERR